MTRRPAPEVFGEWAASGRDEGMAAGHAASVEAMLSLLLPDMRDGFTAIDAGCGNGWVVRLLRADPNCSAASGVDAATEMIAKARRIDTSGDYALADIEHWSPPAPVDLVHSMEVLYYLGDLPAFLTRVRSEWMVEGGTFVAGIDHYRENPDSLDWPDECGIDMNTMTIEQWEDSLRVAGFSEVRSVQVNADGDWKGTLVLIATA